MKIAGKLITLTYKGKTKTLKGWEAETEIPAYVLKQRVKIGTWSVKRILTTPSRDQKEKKITYKGESKTLKQWAKKTGISPQALRYRLFKKWDLDKVFNHPVKSQVSKERNVNRNDYKRSMLKGVDPDLVNILENGTCNDLIRYEKT